MNIREIYRDLIAARTWAVIGESKKAQFMLSEIRDQASTQHFKRVKSKWDAVNDIIARNGDQPV